MHIACITYHMSTQSIAVFNIVRDIKSPVHPAKCIGTLFTVISSTLLLDVLNSD